MDPAGLQLSCRQARLLSFFRDQRFVDCTFTIDNQQIKAHKLILSGCSPVFERMFYGEMASNEITLDDIEMEEFRQMLEFMYTDRIDLSSIMNAWSMFYVAKKYILDDLVEECLGYISGNLTMSTLVLSYEYSELYSLEKLKEQCLRDIIDGLNGIFVTDYHMKPSTLRTILKEDLRISNIDLICRLIEWTINECKLRKIRSNAKNIVEVMKEEDILKYIRRDWVCKVICEYCNDAVVKCRCIGRLVRQTLILLATEIHWVDEPPLENCNKSFPLLCKTRKVYKIARRVDLRHNEEFVSNISVSVAMVISGLLLCTEMNGSFNFLDEYKGYITVKFCEQDSDRSLAKPTIMKSTFHYNYHVFVPLRYAVIVEPDKIYDVRISYTNFLKKSSIVCNYMSDELLDVKRGHSKIRFYDVQGTIIQGVAYYPF